MNMKPVLPANVLKSPEVTEVVKAALRMAMRQTMLTPGQWLASLSDFELAQLVEMAEAGADRLGEAGDPDDEAARNIVLLMMILTGGEGCLPESDEEAVSHTGKLIAFIVLESLHRKGMVRLFRDKLSFVDNDAIIVEKIDFGDEETGC